MRLRHALLIALTALATAPAVAGGHAGNPDYLSEVRSVTPASAGIRVEVLNRDDSLALTSPGGRLIEIEGYSVEPYARILPDGTVQVNTNSAAYYLNQDRFETKPPPEHIEGKPPAWKEVDSSGRFEWHDHRAHWMGKERPRQVTDPDKPTKVFDWTVPLKVDGRAGAISGTLMWTPRPGGGVPAWALVALAVLVVASAVVAVVVRRRRFAAEEPREAW